MINMILTAKIYLLLCTEITRWGFVVDSDIKGFYLANLGVPTVAKS